MLLIALPPRVRHTYDVKCGIKIRRHNVQEPVFSFLIACSLDDPPARPPIRPSAKGTLAYEVRRQAATNTSEGMVQGRGPAARGVRITGGEGAPYLHYRCHVFTSYILQTIVDVRQCDVVTQVLCGIFACNGHRELSSVFASETIVAPFF